MLLLSNKHKEYTSSCLANKSQEVEFAGQKANIVLRLENGKGKNNIEKLALVANLGIVFNSKINFQLSQA